MQEILSVKTAKCSHGKLPFHTLHEERKLQLSEVILIKKELMLVVTLFETGFICNNSSTMSISQYPSQQIYSTHKHEYDL